MTEPLAPLLRTEQEVSADAVVIRLAGELDVSTAAVLDAAVAGLRPFGAPLSLDVTDVAFVDSSGLRALTAARRAAIDDIGAPVTLVGCSATLRSLLEMTGLEDAFTTRDEG